MFYHGPEGEAVSYERGALVQVQSVVVDDKPDRSPSLLPRGGRALVKRLGLGVSKIDWSTIFDIVVNRYRGRFLMSEVPLYRCNR